MDEFEWEQVKQQFPLGAVVTGTATQVVHYGVWVDLGGGITGLLLVPEAGLERGQTPPDCVSVGQSVTATVLWHNDERREIRLTKRA
jgi:small subunit ribosomal protein S1